MHTRPPRMTIARVAEQLLREFPECFAEYGPFLSKKRMIGLVNDGMSRGALPWILHRGQRRITPAGLDAFLAAERDCLAALAARSRAAAAEPERERPIAERYPLPKNGVRKKRARRKQAPEVDTGPSLGEIE